MELEKSGIPDDSSAFQWDIAGQTRETYEVYFKVSKPSEGNKSGFCYKGCGMGVSSQFLS